MPLDVSLGIAGRERTAEADKKITIVGLLGSFEGAARALEELAGIEVSSRIVEEVTEAAGRKAKQQARKEAEAAKKVVLPNAGSVLDWRKDKLPVLYIEPDGTMVPMRPEDRPVQEPTEDRPGTHREAKVGVIFWQRDVMNVSPKRREVRRKRYVATMGDVEEFRENLWAVVAQTAGTVRFQPVILGDGADWISNTVNELFPDAIQILDIFHPLERLWEVGRLIFGHGDLAARPWVKEQQARLERSEVGGVLDELREKRGVTPFNPGDKAALQDKVDKTVAYIQKRRHMMDYAAYQAAGLMIGSGIVESSNRRVIGLRLKQAGMHWSKAGADAVMHVRALYLSEGDGWDRLWERLATPA